MDELLTLAAVCERFHRGPSSVAPAQVPGRSRPPPAGNAYAKALELTDAISRKKPAHVQKGWR